MKSIIADYAQTRTEYVLLVGILASLSEPEREPGTIEDIFAAVLQEYREMPQ